MHGYYQLKRTAGGDHSEPSCEAMDSPSVKQGPGLTDLQVEHKLTEAMD